MESVFAVIEIAREKSAYKLLPQYSNLDFTKWADYFKKKNSVRMMWPSQILIGEKELLVGKNAIVQLPTGVGKTKSIELIIQSMFLSNRGRIALVIAPLRALCNEITGDMRKAFREDATINQFSDVLEVDYIDAFNNTADNKILICTPEKKVKYGVSSETSISICEKICNERLIADKVTDIIGAQGISDDKIISVTKSHFEVIKETLESYPSYFINRFAEAIK